MGLGRLVKGAKYGEEVRRESRERLGIRRNTSGTELNSESWKRGTRKRALDL